MQKQRGEKQERRIAQERDCQVQIPVSADRREEVKDKGSQTERSEVQSKRRAPALLEEDKEPDYQIDQTDQVDVEITRGPTLNSTEMVNIGPVVTALYRIRRPFEQIMNFAIDSRLVQVHLDVAGVNDLVLFVAVETDAE